MIALDTNVLVRYLMADDAEQAQAARTLLEDLTAERPAFICREVMIELVWVLERAYRLPRDRIAFVLQGLIATDGLEVEVANDVARAASRYGQGDAGFANLMIACAAERSGASPLYTFDQRFARVEGTALLNTQSVALPRPLEQ